MPRDETVLCTICARGGSKGVPGKNVRDVAGKPLVAHTVEDARAWDGYDDLVVSTDDSAIAEVAVEYGAKVPFTRPDRLATDSAPKLPVVQHALEKMENITGSTYDYVVDLDPTSPLRIPSDIEDCFQVASLPDVENAVTVTEADRNPYFNMVELDADGYASLVKDQNDGPVRRQDASTVYDMNASVYVFERDFLATTDTVLSDRTKVSVMPPERSVDIDREIDLSIVEFLLEQRDSE